MKFISNIPVEIKDHDVIRLLGHVKHQDKELSGRFVRLYEEEKRYARRLIDPKAVFIIEDISSVPKREIFVGAEKVVFSLTSIGSKLEDRVSKLSAGGKLERSVVLDAIGSSTVESAADFVNEKINQRAEELGYDYTHRFSPGYCIWDISDQKLFFDTLPADQVGVKLTRSMMMAPRKSVTFSINFGYKETMDMSLGQRDCGTCSKADCKYRGKRMEYYIEKKFDK